MEESYLKPVTETRTRTVTACVPQIERVAYDVQVTKMFPKTGLLLRTLRDEASSAGGAVKGRPIPFERGPWFDCLISTPTALCGW